MKRTVFFISDGTGITAETVGHSLLTQFPAIEFEQVTIPYVTNEEKARAAIHHIHMAFQNDGQRPLIFTTFVNTDIYSMLTQNCNNALFVDLVQPFIKPLETELNCTATHAVNRSHSLQNYENYMARIEAVNYTLTHDDGVNVRNYDHADIILIGVSRCGKTPTCLYLALQFGLFAANYPITEDDLTKTGLPEFLSKHRNKLFGLTIDPFRLQQIRQQRKPNSRYAQLDQCQFEIQKVEALFNQEKIHFLSTTTRSIEEISSEILALTGIKRRSV